MAEVKKSDKVPLNQTRFRVPIKDDIFASAGYWEPIAFTIRRGKNYVGLQDDEYPYSEEMAKKLHDIGITVAIWHYYKGLGEKAEQEEMKKTAKFFKHLDKYGITRGVYINAGSFFVDTFIAENPEAKDWVAYDQWGNEHIYSEDSRNYYRWRPCSNNKEYGEYVGRMAVKAIKDGADYVQFDNSAQMPCYCKKCREGFPAYVLEKYPVEPREGTITFKERFGHDFNGTFEIPRNTGRYPIDNLPAAAEPGLYEWIRYRQSRYEQTLKTTRDMIRAACPDGALGWNIAVNYGEFPGLVWGLDAELTYRYGLDCLYSEDGIIAGMQEGRLISHIRMYKYGRAMKCRIGLHNPYPGPLTDAQKLLNYVEAAAFNDGCVGKVMWATDPDDGRYDLLKKTLKFLRNNREFYVHTRCMSRIAVYRCRESETANFAYTRASRQTIEQVLIKNSIQFDYIINDRFDEIGNYELLICANTPMVSAAIAGKIADFVRNGGKIFCTEQFLTHDEYQRMRKLNSCMGRDREAGVAEILEYLGLEEKFAENIFYLPGIDYARKFSWESRTSDLPRVGDNFYVEPLNKQEVLELLMQALGCSNIELTAPENVIAGCFECVDGRGPQTRKRAFGVEFPFRKTSRNGVPVPRKVVHVLDYEAGRELSGIKLRFKTDGEKQSKAKFVTIDSESDVELEWDGDFATCVLPAFNTYGFLRV